ncbi:MAG TPA: PhoU domain-containing protein [Pseudonocardiaceae bacterium]|jgi:phosphate transport system protein|nr:PhoU domain-containing protein [Pseudonocardiaceae bacterium]
MRERFRGELRRLGGLLAGMSATAGRQLSLATESLLRNDLGVSDRVLAEDAGLDRNRDRCVADAQRLLALQAPVAGDLRAVLAAVYCAERIERMGDLARHVAEMSRRAHPLSAVPLSLHSSFAELGRMGVRMADAVTVLIGGEDGSAAFDRMVADDDRVRAAHRRLMGQVVDPRWPYGVAVAVNVALLGRFYGRFADQAVSVARRLEFAVTGTLPR